MENMNVAEEAARANAVGNLQKTTVADMLQDYHQKTVQLKSGRIFDIVSFLPGNLLLNIESPLVLDFLAESDTPLDTEPPGNEKPLDLYQTRVPAVLIGTVRQLVAEHITNIPVSLQPQSQCPEGVVSIDRFTLDEIRELFKEMCVLSGALSFPETETED